MTLAGRQETAEAADKDTPASTPSLIFHRSRRTDAPTDESHRGQRRPNNLCSFTHKTHTHVCSGPLELMVIAQTFPASGGDAA